MNICIYCPEPADTKEHVLPAAFGEFEGAPYLKERICHCCNNNRLGLLDEQFARCGPEGFLRRHYDIRGRSSHMEVNPFYRGSAGGFRLEMLAHDSHLGVDVLLECEDGKYQQARQLIFVEESGTTHHLPFIKGITAEDLRAHFEQLHVNKPFVTHIICAPEEEDWVDSLIKEAWPQSTRGGTSVSPSTSYQGAVTKVVLTDRYFRAVAKVAFHYFLSQFPTFTGHEPMFARIREFILTDGQLVDRANDFVGIRQSPLLGEMMTPGARPSGWRAHILCAESRSDACLAYVQMFLSEDWPAPTYVVTLGTNSAIVDSSAAGHAFLYYPDGPRGQYAGETQPLAVSRSNFPPRPPLPAVKLP